MYKTITLLTRLKAGAVPSQFTWTKARQERPQNKLQNFKNMNEQQAQEERRQSFVDLLRQDVELEEVTESAVQEASASSVSKWKKWLRMKWKTKTFSLLN